MEQAAAALPPAEARAVGDGLVARRLHLPAAYAFRAGGVHEAAASAFEAAERPILAARAYREAGNRVLAARVLTARRKVDPEDGEAALLLGEILAEAGRLEQAARALQAVGVHTPQHALARSLLASVLGRLGLPEARESLGDVGEVAGALEATAPHRTLLFGRYEVKRTAASSPTARVLLAVDRLTNNLVAVKLLQSSGSPAGRDAQGRFEREARALTLLRHPHVLPLLAFFPDGPAAVFPWQPGGALSGLLEKGPLAPDHAAFVVVALLDAVAAAHAAGILHRDIKPSNVLFDGAMSPSLADFGAAHVGEADTTVTAGLIGSLAYMAPEQLAAEPATTATDVYAVGAVLYECLTGLAPRPAEELEVLPSGVYPGELDERHDEVVRGLLRRDPKARTASASEARDAVRALTWTAHGAPQVSAREERPAAVGHRLRSGALGVFVDEVLRREIRLLPAALLPLARLVASRDLRAIEAPLRVDPVSGAVWVEVASGAPFDETVDFLSPDEAGRLAAAIGALHREGLSHGALLPEAIVLTREGPVWRFPTSVGNCTVATERAALDAFLPRLIRGSARPLDSPVRSR